MNGWSRGIARCALCVISLALSLPAAGEAQEPTQLKRFAEQLLGRPLSADDILNLIRSSGLSPDEVRRRLERAGLPREAADPYLAVLGGEATAIPAGTDPVPLLTVLGLPSA